jgi:hypothetical protein
LSAGAIPPLVTEYSPACINRFAESYEYRRASTIDADAVGAVTRSIFTFALLFMQGIANAESQYAFSSFHTKVGFPDVPN